MFRIRLAATCAVVAIAVTACSSSPAPHSSSGPAASGTAHPSAAAAIRQSALACAGLVPFDESVLTYPGGDSGGTPSAAQLRRAGRRPPRRGCRCWPRTCPSRLIRTPPPCDATTTTIATAGRLDPTSAQYAGVDLVRPVGTRRVRVHPADVTNTATGLTGVPSALPAER